LPTRWLRSTIRCSVPSLRCQASRPDPSCQGIGTGRRHRQAEGSPYEPGRGAAPG
jgi:hypothetical protein